MPFPVEFKPDMVECVERMRRLWAMEEPLDRVPAHIVLPRPPGRKADGSFYGRMDDYLRYQEEVFRRQREIPDETLPVVHPQYGHALISALCGSPIKASGDTVWSVPFLEDYAQAEELSLRWDNPWGRRFQEDVARMLEWAEGRAFVANYEIEGVSDTMTALMDPTRLMTDLMLRSDAVRRYAARVTGLLVEFAQWNHRNVATRQEALEGTAVGWRIWMPPDSIHFTEDHSVMLSPQQYRDSFLEHDIRLTSAFDKTLLEVHKEGNHQIANFAAIPNVSMLTVENLLGMDASHRESLRPLLGKKALRIVAREKDIETALSFTGARGVLLVIPVEDAAQGNRVLENLRRLGHPAGS